MKILFLTTVLPSRKLHGSEIASQNIIDALGQAGCDVEVLGYGRQEDGELEIAPGEVLVAERAVETKQVKYKAALWFAQSLMWRLPYSAAKYYTTDYVEQVRSRLSPQGFDAIVIDHSQLGWLLPLIRSTAKRLAIQPPPLIFSAHNIEHEIYRQHQHSASNPLSRWVYGREARTIQQLEDQLAQGVNQVWTLTDHDAQYFSQVAPRTQAYALSLPSGLDRSTLNSTPDPLDPLPKRPEPQFDIGLIGSWPWKPNEEGLRWFLDEVYPHLPQSLSIQVAGRGADWLHHRYPNVTYRGFVPSAQDFMASAKVVAIPTLSGGGIQIKTLDAIATGSLIVGTGIALRGIPNPPDTVRLADDPEDFAKALQEAVHQPSLPAAWKASARTWDRDRQQQFLRDVQNALSQLSAPTC